MANKQLKTLADFNNEIVQKGDVVFPLKLKELLEEDDLSSSACFIRLKPRFYKVVPDIVNKVTKETLEGLKLNSIIMPIMPVEDTIQNQWGSVEGAQLLAGGASLPKAIDYAKWMLLRGASAALPDAISATLKQSYFKGATINPYDKMIYQGHQRRSIPITFNFLKPESAEDEKNLRSIVNLIRTLSVGSYSGIIITQPIQWDLEFVSLPDYDRFLKYTRCGIESVSVKFGGDGENFNAMKTGMPFLSLSVVFNELYYPTKKDLVI